MARKRKRKGWAGVPLIAGVLGLIALLLTCLARPDLLSFVLAGALALLGIAFLWAFYISPIVQVWKIVLTVVFVLLFVLTLWLDRNDLKRIWA